VTIKNYTI